MGEDDVYEMLCDNDAENYQGLDCDRDTKAEVQTAIRFFPNVLSREDEDDECSLQCLIRLNDLSFNFRAVPFIAVLAWLGIELHQFGRGNQRGGLLVEDRYGKNVLQRVENVCLAELVQLRRMGLLKKEDIREYDLLHNLSRSNYFSENRFRFLAEWVPTSLRHINAYGHLLLHHVSNYSTIQNFHFVFEYGIRYYPNKDGFMLLFIKGCVNGATPFQLACKKF